MVQTRGDTNAAVERFEQHAKHWMLDQDDFILHECVGEGGEGCVYRATHILSDVEVALKRIPDDDYFVEQESDIHCQLHHTNILRFYGMFCDDDATFLITEYCPEGTMMHVMRGTAFATPRQKEAFVAKAILQILFALKYLHDEQNIMHRDIKPENLLWNNDAPKLGDFGMSAELESSNHHRETEFAGTVTYMAPEVLAMTEKYRLKHQEQGANEVGDGGTAAKGGTTAVDGTTSAKDGTTAVEAEAAAPAAVQVSAADSTATDATASAVNTAQEEWERGYSYKADSWSLGVTTYELLTGRYPFPLSHDDSKLTQEIRGYIQRSFSHQAISWPNTVSQEAKDFILSLLKVNPEERLSVDEAMKHPWIVRHTKNITTTTKQPVDAATAVVEDKENTKPKVDTKANTSKKDVIDLTGVNDNNNVDGGMIDEVEALLGGLNLNA